MRNRKAYTLIESLIVISVLPLLFSLIFSILSLIIRYDYGFITRQNVIGIIQLRARVALGSEIVLKEGKLIMTYQNQPVHLYCDDDKLIEYDGYMEYLIGLDQCQWEITSGLVYLNYSEHFISRKVFIGYVA